MISIKKLHKSDIKDIAELHHKSFKGFFLTSLGRPFLKVFYESILADKKGICVGAVAHGTLIGFAVGITNNHGFYSSILKKNYVRMIWAALPVLIIRPSIVKKLIKLLLMPPSVGNKTAPVLLSICVLPHQESKGVGKKMIAAFEQEVLNRGFDELTLTTDFDSNDYANHFYSRNGYSVIESFFQGNRKMNLYYKKLQR